MTMIWSSTKIDSQTTREKDLPEPKKQKIKETPLELPDVFMEGDSPTKK